MSALDPTTARTAAVAALLPAVENYPHLKPVELDFGSLPPRDRALALAIVRTVLQRWMTIEHLLNQALHQPFKGLEPTMRGVLLVGASQLLFFDRLPAYAVVNESVDLARSLVRPSAGSMVNAVLRILAKNIVTRCHTDPWTASADQIPLEDGFIRLGEISLPETGDLIQHLAVATSHPPNLVEQWSKTYGDPQATKLCLHSLRSPPIFIATASGYTQWTGRGEQLSQYLSLDSTRRVQDPAAGKPVQATAHLKPKMIIDFCAGRGTKTHQLAQLHPQARIFATDGDPERLKALHATYMNHPSVTVVPLEQLQGPADLLLLDVPCTNTAVLARRPEARYRYTSRLLHHLVRIQRQVMNRAITCLDTKSSVLYSTCSLEQAENQDQTRWLANRIDGTLKTQCMTLPDGHGPTYHDGGYFALLQRH